VVDVSGESDETRLVGKELTISYARDTMEAFQDGNLGSTEWLFSQLSTCTCLGRLTPPQFMTDPAGRIRPMLWARQLDEAADGLLDQMAQEQGAKRWGDAINSLTFAVRLSAQLLRTSAEDVIDQLPTGSRGHEPEAPRSPSSLQWSAA
jgi:hypothetical protein